MRQILGHLALFLIMNSCGTDEFNTSDFVAGEIFTDSNIRAIRIDTMAVETYTIKFDSLITSQATRMLIGRYNDPVFGAVNSSSFVEFLPYSYYINSEAEYDSIAFILKYDSYYYNDTLKSNTIRIKELSELMKPADGTNYYNSSNVSFSDEDLGSLTYAPRPLGNDSLSIKLSDTFGASLFEKLQQKKITNIQEFKDFFHGMTFQPDEGDDGSIVGFSYASSVMRMYYTVSEENGRTQYTTDFSINTTSNPIPLFNKISVAESNEYLKTLTNKEIEISSSISGNQSFIQSGIGYATKIEFPNLKTLFDIQGRGTLLNAVLKIKPVIGSYNDQQALRDILVLYVVDQNNDVVQQLVSADNSVVQATLNRDGEEFNDIYYEIPLTSYIEGLLQADRETDDAIILLSEDYNSTLDRFVLMGNEGTDQGIKLELTYAIYDENE